MGCSASKGAASVAPKHVAEEVHSALEKALLKSITDAKRRQGPKMRRASFNGLMLQFPRLRTGFKKVHELFLQLDTSSQGTISFEQFQSRCAVIGLNSETTSLQDIFQLADMEGTKQLNKTEFVLVFTIIYLMDDGSKKAIQHPEIKKALDIIEKAFTFFDTSSDGFLERKELAMAMKSGTRVFGNKESKSLADRLFDILDWDKSGCITFKEFLVGIERMVMDEWQDEDEQDAAMMEELEADEEEDMLDADDVRDPSKGERVYAGGPKAAGALAAPSPTKPSNGAGRVAGDAWGDEAAARRQSREDVELSAQKSVSFA